MQPLRIQTIRPPKSPKPDVVALASRFVEPLARENRPAPAHPAPSRPKAVASAECFTGQLRGTSTQPDRNMAPAKPMARGKSGLNINVLISALVVIALVPSAVLFVQLWQDMMRPHSVTLRVTAPPAAEPPRSAGLDYPKDGSRFAVEDGDDTPSFAGVDTGDGGPGSAGGWSFASEETGALPSAAAGAKQLDRHDPRAGRWGWPGARAAHGAAEHGPLARRDRTG